MSNRLSTLLFAVAIAVGAGSVTPAEVQITTTDTEGQACATLVLKGNTLIQQLIGQYGAGALPMPPSTYMQQNLDWVHALTAIAPTAKAGILTDFTSAGGILIGDGHAIAVPSFWGAGLTGNVTAARSAYRFALASPELVDAITAPANIPALGSRALGLHMFLVGSIGILPSRERLPGY